MSWVKLFREIRNHWIWQDPQKLKWWLDLIMEANHKDKKVAIGYELIDCKRGQCVRSLSGWAKRFRTDKSTIHRFFTMLKNDTMIETENISKTTRITICNYDTYNEVRNDEETVNETVNETMKKRDATQHKNNTSTSTNGTQEYFRYYGYLSKKKMPEFETEMEKYQWMYENSREFRFHYETAASQSSYADKNEKTNTFAKTFYNQKTLKFIEAKEAPYPEE